jgi:hypothetical protein
MSRDIITYPELRALKGKYTLTDSQMADITGDKAYQTFKRKLDCESEFSGSDMVNVVNYFQKLGEDISIKKIFFDWIFSIEEFSA